MWRKVLAEQMRSRQSQVGLEVACRQLGTAAGAFLVQHGYLTSETVPALGGFVILAVSLLHGITSRSNVEAALIEANKELSDQLEECRRTFVKLQACRSSLEVEEKRTENLMQPKGNK
jgi:predicted peroxiredoxin